MRRRMWMSAGAVAVLAAGFTLIGGGHPWRVLTGMISGPEALAYLPPRQEVPLEPGPPQPTLSLADAGIDPQALDLAVEYAEARNTRALVVGLNGHVVFHRFWDGASLDGEAELSGFTPVLSALLLGTALQNGELRNIDTPLSTYLPEWATDPRGTITLRDLLTGNSHLAAAEGRLWPRSRAARYYAGGDPVAALLTWPQAQKPDPAGSPAEVDADVLVLALSRALKSDYPKMLKERLWVPMGAGGFSLSPGRAGCCLRARISDWMRLGAMIANHGIFEGNQFAPPDYATLLITPVHEDAARAVFMRVDGQFAARDLVRLEAAGKQRLWMVPSLKLVILRTGGEPAEDKGWDEAMIPDSIIRGTRGWRPAGSGADGQVDPSLFAPH